jgi:hypothetical protein
MARKAKGAQTWTTLKVPVPVHALAKEILRQISQRGWQSVGCDRQDPPTFGALLEEGLLCLQRQLKVSP